jgi:hypothetical protein
MTSQGRKAAPRSAFGGSLAYLCAIAALVALPLWPALAQQAPLAPANQPPAPPTQAQPQPPAIPPAEAAPPPAEAAPPKKEGFFDAFEKWWDKSAADFKASVDKSQEDWRKLNERNEKAAKEAADVLSKLSGSRIVEGRELCEVAPNGSPDCQAAAEKICKAKGFALGKSADIQTNRKCSARAWLSGNPSESACTFETIVTKAACQ